jgi:hypothetical protein
VSARSPSGQCEPEMPANSYSPSCFPKISFMSPEHGTGGHAGSSKGKDSPQMSLFEDGGDDLP